MAGLKIVSPSNASDAYWMMQQAIQSDDPVIYFEPKRRYWDKAEVDFEAIPAPLHKARVVREGTDLTLAAYGPMVKLCQEAADAAAEEGKSLEVLDLRSVSPLDFDSLQASVEKTRRLVVVHEAPVFFGSGAGDRRPDHRALFLPPGGTGPARRRLPRPVPAGAPGGGVPAGPGPRARRRRPLAGVLEERVVTTMTEASVREFKMPDVGEGLTEAEILKWYVQPGDTVTDGQVVCEVETAKAAVELPIPYDGVVRELHFPEGTTVDVGTPIIAVAVAGGAAPEAPAEQPAAEPARPQEEPKPEGRQPVLVGYGVATSSTKRRPRKGPEVTVPAPAQAIQAELNGHAGRGRREAAPRWPSPRCASWPRTWVSTWRAITPSGPDGIITREDVHAAATPRTAEPQAPVTTAPATPAAPGSRGVLVRRRARDPHPDQEASARPPRRRWSPRRSPRRTSPSS